jgi:hypothetical protein
VHGAFFLMHKEDHVLLPVLYSDFSWSFEDIFSYMRGYCWFRTIQLFPFWVMSEPFIEPVTTRGGIPFINMGEQD